MHAGRVAAAAALRCAIAACLAAFFGWMFLYPTGVQKRSLAVRNGLQISSLSGSTVLTLMLTCLSLLLATWATLLLRRTLSAHCAPVKRTSNGLLAKARSVLAWQVPPRAVLAGWCGGLSLAELAGILAWLLINAYWLGMLLQRSLPGRENWRDRLEKVAVAFGKMMAPNLMLLFLPVPHVSFITQLTGCSRNQLIRYHRWLGHGTIWVLNLHALLYYLYWGATSTFWQEIKAWDGKVNNLAGVIAWLFVLALWVSSLEPIRRRMYQVFFRFHIACFVGFFLFACAHYAACWTYFAPGLLLYGADLVLRSGQLANVTPVVAAVVDDAAGIATLQFESDTALTHKPLSEVWLLAPQVSRWQWHPFTVASGGGPHLTLHTKRYGRFTRSLLDGLRRRTVTSVRLTGPHGASSCSAGCQLSPPDSYSKYDSMVMIGGGVGVTALLSMLRHMVSQRASGQSHGLPSHVCCVWAARSPAEFASLDGPLLQAAAEAGWLELRLHLTASSAPICTQLTRLQQPRQQQPADMSPGGLQSVPSWARTSSDHSLKAGKGPEVGALLGAGDADVAVLAPPRACSASPYFWNLLRPVQPAAMGASHLAAIYLLAYLGAFCAALLAASYSSQVEQWKGGMVYAVLVSAMALGLPFGLAVFPVHAYRYRRASRLAEIAGKAGAVGLAPFSQTSRLLDSCVSVDADGVRVGDVAVPVRPGRPDVAALLRDAAAQAAPGAVVGVYAGGPKPMMTAVHLAVCQLNADGAGAYLELHREAVEL